MFMDWKTHHCYEIRWINSVQSQILSESLVELDELESKMYMEYIALWVIRAGKEVNTVLLNLLIRRCPQYYKVPAPLERGPQILQVLKRNALVCSLYPAYFPED